MRSFSCTGEHSCEKTIITMFRVLRLPLPYYVLWHTVSLSRRYRLYVRIPSSSVRISLSVHLQQDQTNLTMNKESCRSFFVTA
ncbi:MAG: hypothetical protein ACK53Y_17965, partial [bacterium]